MDSNMLGLLEKISLAVLASITSITIAVTPIVISSKKKVVKDTSKAYLCNHIIFHKFLSYKRIIQYEFKIPDPGKEIVYKEILLFMLNEFHRNLFELAKSIDKMEKSELDTLSLAYINSKVIEKSINSTLEMYKDTSYSRDESEVIEIVLSKFNNWNIERFNRLETMIGQVSESIFYTNKKTCQSVVFDLFISFILDMIHDAQAAFARVNGDLCGKKFKGVIIGH